MWLCHYKLRCFLFAILVSLLPSGCGSKADKALPVFEPSDIHPSLVDTHLRDKVSPHHVSDFKLINQFGDTITQKEFSDRIYVVDFFFTRCPTICPVMSLNMAKIQEAFKEENRLLLLSVTVTPEYDSVPVLYEYAQEKGAIPSKWHITTGDKKHIYELARKSYFMVSDEGDGGLQDFIHTANFELIDAAGRIRGIYDGTSLEETERLIADIRSLL